MAKIGAIFSLAWSLPQFGWIAEIGLQSGAFDAHMIGWLLIVILFLVTHLIAISGLYWLWLIRKWPCSIALSTVWFTVELITDACLKRGFGLSLDPVRLAVSQLDNGPFAQSADLGGVSLVGWLVTLTNGLVVDAFVDRKRQTTIFPRAFSCMFGLLMASAIYGYLRLITCGAETGPSVTLIPDIWRDSMEFLSENAPPADLVVWPETALAGTLNLDDHLEDALKERSHRLDSSIVVGCQRFSESPTGLFNSACLCSADGHSLEVSDKRFLGPISEFVPPLGKYFGVSPPSTEYRPGNSACWTVGGKYRVGVGICLDASFAEWNRALALGEPDLLLVIANESFTRSNQIRSQLLACARLRAIESRRTLLRCSLNGITCVIDACGRIVAKNPDWRLPTPLFIGNAPITRSRSVYHAVGETLVWMVVFGTAILGEYVGIATRRNGK